MQRTEQRSRTGLILAALCSAALIINIDVTIVNVTLPSLVRELGATTTQLQWVVDAYSLVFASLILAAGSLSDRFGRKGVLLAGLAVFATGSLGGALASTPNQLIAARAFMGIGAAAIFPSTLSLIANIFIERRERAKAIGLWGATTGVGVAIGPIVGGWLLVHYWWGSVFLFMVPVAAVVAMLVGFAVPTSRDPSTPPIDWRGVLLSTVGMGLIVLSIIQAPTWGWVSGKTLGAAAIGLVVMVAFVRVESRTARPMLDVTLFKNLRFTAASGSIMIAFFTLAGFTFLVTQYFQFVRGYTAFGTGLRILPVAISIAVAAIVGTRLAVRIGNKAVVATGLFAFGLALFWISAAASVTTSYAVLAATDDPVRHRPGAHHRTRYRIDLGRRPEGEGRGGLGRERRDPAVRSHARGGGHREYLGVALRGPSGSDDPGRAAGSGCGRREGLGRRCTHRGTGAAARRPAGTSTGVGRGRDQRVPPQLLVEPSRRRPRRVRRGRAGRHPAPFPSRTRSIRRRRGDRCRLGRVGG